MVPPAEAPLLLPGPSFDAPACCRLEPRCSLCHAGAQCLNSLVVRSSPAGRLLLDQQTVAELRLIWRCRWVSRTRAAIMLNPICAKGVHGAPAVLLCARLLCCSARSCL